MNYTQDSTNDSMQEQKRFYNIEEDLDSLIKGLTNISNEYFNLSDSISHFDDPQQENQSKDSEPIDIMGRLERKVERLKEIRNHLDISLNNLREVF